MGENVNFRNFRFGSMLPLDMLAEVASETLKNDPSLCFKHDLDIKETPAIGDSKSCSPKRSASNSEKLTLDQIRSLSDKSLLEMFSAHSSDEIRKKFSYKCCLIPGKCDKIISSFGNETKASFQMKLHLVSHRDDLINESNAAKNNGNLPFEAEPLNIRKRKLETGSKKRKKFKSMTKKVKSLPQKQTLEKKVLPVKSKVVKNAENKVKKDVKTSNKGRTFSTASMLHGLFSARFKKCSKNVRKGDKLEKENERYQALMEESFLSLPTSKSLNGTNFMKQVSNSKNLINSSGTFSKKLKSEGINADIETLRKSTVRKKEVNVVNHNPIIQSDETKSSKFEVKCNVNNNFWSNSVESIFSNCIKQEPAMIYPFHDHTYTSINGKTFIEPNAESVKNVSKVFKEGRKVPVKSPSVPVQLIISTPPFPFVYTPVLPHIGEIREIGNHKYRSSDKSTQLKPQSGNRCLSVASKAFNLSPQGLTEANNTHCQKINQIVIPQDLGIETEDDENMPHSFTVTNGMEGRLQECETNDNSITKCNSEETDTKNENAYIDSSSGTVIKLALKCIRQLRTKKKEERGPLICQICKDKSFTAQATLMYHYRSHAGIKPFSCSVCDATFTRQHSLNYHMLIHNNKSRFVCTDCGRNFRHPSHYKEHLRRHTGETPYQCTDCNLRFKTRNTYKRHLKTRHGKILTARGIRILSLEEFDKVRTSPRKRISKHVLQTHKNEGTGWQNVTFSDVQLPGVELKMFEG